MPLNASVDITTGFRSGRTILKRSFCNSPFKVADVTEDKNQERLELMLMSASPGMLDGDATKMQIELVENSSLKLTTQSYQRLFSMKGRASHENLVILGNRASFTYLPHPSVPHADSNYHARNRIYLSDHCNLAWGEIISCGRKGNDEIFRFSLYHSITEVFLNGRLCIRENLCINPAGTSLMGIGNMEGYTHQASLLLINNALDIASVSGELDRYLKQFDDITYGVTELPVRGLLVRLLGQKGEQLFDCIKALACLVESTFTRPGGNQKMKVYAR